MLNHYNKVIDMNNCDVSNMKAYIPNNLENSVFIHKICNIDGSLYYAKRVWAKEEEDCLVNELIGSYLSRLIDLDAVDYKIGKQGQYIYALSKLFYEEDFDYEYSKKYNSNFDLDSMNKKFIIDNLPNEYPHIREKLLKLALLDIKMGQYDRYNETNIMLKKSKITNFIDLAPIYDFGFSYPLPTIWNKDAFVLYTNYFLTIRKNEESLQMLLNKYPQIYDIMYKLADIDMNSIIKDIEDSHEILIEKGIKNNLIEQDQEYSCLLKKVL